MYKRLYNSEIRIKTEYSKKELECIQARNKVEDFLEDNGKLFMKLEDRMGTRHNFYSIDGISTVMVNHGWLSSSPLVVKLYSDEKPVEEITKKIASLSDVLEIKEIF